MKLIYAFILLSVVMLCPASLRADTSSAVTDTVRSHSPGTSVAPQILSDVNYDTNEVAQKQPEFISTDEKTIIVLTQRNEAETKEAPEAAVADRKNVTEEVEEEAPGIPDPLAPLNKAMYHVNDKLYFWALKPVTQVYSHIVPEDVRVVFGNFYDNLWAPSRMLNSLFQLRLKTAGNELIRFLFNSFAGIGGLGDVAKDALGIKKQETDFGQTLGHYGMGHGFYLVLPVLGPSSLRDGVGLVGDYFMYPLTYVSSSDLTFGESAGIYAHEKVNDTSFKIGDYETFKDSAIDPYVSMRDAFVQHRKKVVEESKQ